MEKSKLQSIVIALLVINQVWMNIKMNSYVRDMNSLLEINQLQDKCLDSMYECHQIEFELFQYIFENL